MAAEVRQTPGCEISAAAAQEIKKSAQKSKAESRKQPPESRAPPATWLVSCLKITQDPGRVITDSADSTNCELTGRGRKGRQKAAHEAAEAEAAHAWAHEAAAGQP